MLKKLTALSLSLLICLSLLPGKAAAMDVPENETPVQAEDVEDQISPEDAGAGIAPCMAVARDTGVLEGYVIYIDPWESNGKGDSNRP